MRNRKPKAWMIDGALADYHSMIGQEVTKPGVTLRGAPFKAASGHWVVFVTGVSGYVSIDALSPYIAAAEADPGDCPAACGRCLYCRVLAAVQHAPLFAVRELESGDRLAAEARERAEKATEGPWLRDDCSRPDVQVIAHHNEVIAYHRRHERQLDSQVVPNFQFMADARQSVPALCAEVERRGKAIRHIPHCGVCLVDLKYHDRFCPEVAAILEGK